MHPTKYKTGTSKVFFRPLPAALIVSVLWCLVVLLQQGRQSRQSFRFEYEQELLLALQSQSSTYMISPSANKELRARRWTGSSLGSQDFSTEGASIFNDHDHASVDKSHKIHVSPILQNVTQPILDALKTANIPFVSSAEVQFFVGSASCTQICELAFAHDSGGRDCAKSWLPILLVRSVAQAAFPHGCSDGLTLTTRADTAANQPDPICEAGLSHPGERLLCPCEPRRGGPPVDGALLQRAVGRLVAERQKREKEWRHGGHRAARQDQDGRAAGIDEPELLRLDEFQVPSPMAPTSLETVREPRKQAQLHAQLNYSQLLSGTRQAKPIFWPSNARAHLGVIACLGQHSQP
jgi:hypothetical protein